MDDVQEAAIEALALYCAPDDAAEADKIRTAARELGLFAPLTDAQLAFLADRPPELDELLNAVANAIAPPAHAAGREESTDGR